MKKSNFSLAVVVAIFIAGTILSIGGIAKATSCASNIDCGINSFSGNAFCQGGNVYKNFITYSCNNPGAVNSFCSNSSTAQLVQTCSTNQQCSNGYCDGNTGSYNYGNYNYNSNYNYDNSYSNCADYASKQCVGNSVYWYNSCGQQQGVFQACGANSICQNGQCSTIYNPVPAPKPAYISHYSIKCSENNLFWYSSTGARNTLYKSCNDNNPCTTDSCSGKKCSNAAIPNCQQNNAGATLNGLSVSFFVKSDSAATQWQKTVQIGQNSTAYFMVSVANNTGETINDAIISVNIPGQITSLGNAQVDGVPISGDIVSGINIGILSPGAVKSITFEGKTQTFPAQSANQQANAVINAGGAKQSDALSIDFNPNQAASSSSEKSTNRFWEFIKRWYLWILAALVLVFLFIVVFRRLSKDNNQS